MCLQDVPGLFDADVFHPVSISDLGLHAAGSDVDVVGVVVRVGEPVESRNGTRVDIHVADRTFVKVCRSYRLDAVLVVFLVSCFNQCVDL